MQQKLTHRLLTLDFARQARRVGPRTWCRAGQALPKLKGKLMTDYREMMSGSLADQLEALIRKVDPELKILLPYVKVYDLLINMRAAEEIQEAAFDNSGPSWPKTNRKDN